MVKAEAPNYEDWSQENLIKRVTDLEKSLKLFNKYVTLSLPNAYLFGLSAC